MDITQPFIYLITEKLLCTLALLLFIILCSSCEIQECFFTSLEL